MLASLIKYFAVIVVLPALLLASVLTMVFYGVESKEETLPTIALLLPGKISDPGWNRSIYLDTEKAFVQSGIAEIAVVQGVSLDNVAQAIDSVRKRDIHAVILGFDKSDKRIEKVIAANTQMRFAGLFKTFDFYGNYSAYVPRWIFPAYMSGFAAASVSPRARLGLVAVNRGAQSTALINAFVLGARAALPGCMVYVAGLGTAGAERSERAEREAVDRLIDIWEVDSVATMSTTSAVSRHALARKIPYVGFMEAASERHPEYMIAHVRVSTDRIFADMARDFEFGRFCRDEIAQYGLRSGIIGFDSFSGGIASHVMRELRRLEEYFINDGTVFSGPILDTNGRERVSAGEVLSERAFINESWYVDGTYEVP